MPYREVVVVVWETRRTRQLSRGFADSTDPLALRHRCRYRRGRITKVDKHRAYLDSPSRVHLYKTYLMRCDNARRTLP